MPREIISDFANKDEYANSTQAEGILQARCLNRDYQDQQRDKNMFRLYKTGLPFLVVVVNICVWKSGHVYVFDGEKYSTSLKHQYRTAFNTTPYEEVPL